MKRNRLLILGAVAALLLVGVAFAAWTTSVDVNVNAKSGELDVAITKARVVSSSDYVEFRNKNIVVSEDKKTADVTIDNLYPGSEAVFTVQVKNTGTIPVELLKVAHTSVKILDKDTKASYGLDAEMFKYLNAEYTATVLDKKGATVATLPSVNTAASSWLTEDFYVDNDLVQIEPDQSLLLTVRVYLDDKAPDSTENKLFKFSVTPSFGQYNQ